MMIAKLSAITVLVFFGLTGRVYGQLSCPKDSEGTRDRQQKWERILKVYNAGASQGNTSAAFACKLVHQFFTEACPTWNPDVARVEKSVCALVAQEDATKQAALAAQRAEEAKPGCSKLSPGEKRAIAKYKNDELERAVAGGMDIDFPNADLDGVRKRITSFKASIDVLACLGETDSASHWTAVFQTWSATLNEKLAQEEKCRADEECLFARNVIDELCGTIGGRAEVLADIRRTKHTANRVGVVDLAELHDLGEQLERSESSIAELKVQYQEHTKRPFSATVCKKRGF